MKKYSWIMALLLALTLAFIGCPEGGGGGGGGGGPDEPEPPIEGGGIQWGDEPGMKPTLVGTTPPVWSDDNGGTMTIIASSNTGFSWTWAELTAAAGKDIKRDGGNLYVFYVIDVKTPAAALTIKNPADMEANPGSPANWGQGKGAEYVLGDNVLSNYQKGGDKIVSSLYSPDTGRGWFEINPLVYAGSTGIGFQHNFWCDMGTNGTTKIAEKSEYTLKIISIDYAEPDLSVKVNLAAIPGVTVPIKNEAPVAAITDTAQYTGTVAWAPAIAEGGTFAPDTVYTATITLTANEGFTFEGVTANFFTVAGATATNPANSGVVTAVFPATTAEGAADPVTNRTIAGVTAPVGGAIPVTTITADDQFTGTVAWKDASGTAAGATFGYETVYTATITLTPVDGFTFVAPGEDDPFTVTGATTVTFALVAGDPPNSGIVTAVFPATGEPPYVATLDTTDPANVKHTNPIFIKYGGWGTGGITVEGNTTTIPVQQQANFAYVYPTTGTGFDIADFDFVELKLTTTGTVSNFGYKVYPSDSTDAVAGRTGSITTDADSTIKLEIRKIPAGLGFQKHGADANALVVKITEAVYSKGTRYDITLDPNSGEVTPTTTYLVDGTTVANHLPTPTRDEYIFLGWQLGTTTITSATTVDATFEDATLVAQWKLAQTLAPQTVTFNTTSGNGYVVGWANEPAENGPTREANVALVDTPTAGIGYTIDVVNNGYGNAYAYFEYTFTTGTNLSDFDKVTLKYTGVSGDVSGKKLCLLVSTSPFAEYLAFESVSTPISNVNVSGNDETEITLTINQGVASALDGQTLYFAFGIHAGNYKIQIADVTFAQNE